MAGISIDDATLLSTLKRTSFHFIAIRAIPATPKDGPCFVLSNNGSMKTFWDALKEARAFWPNATDFEIVGSNEVIRAGGQNLKNPSLTATPPDAFRLQQPLPLIHFRLT